MAGPDLEWLEFSKGKYVSTRRLFNLYGASKIQGKGLPIQKAVAYCIRLSEKYSGLVIPTYEQYTEMMLRVAEQNEAGNEPFVSFYRTLTNEQWDFTRDIIRFNEMLQGGGYRATLFRFDMNKGKPKEVNDITIPDEGWIKEIGKYGYPSKTSKGPCYIENRVIRGKTQHKVCGKLCIKKSEEEPKKGEFHMIQCNPSNSQKRLFETFLDESLSCAGDMVSALLMRYD